MPTATKNAMWENALSPESDEVDWEMIQNQQRADILGMSLVELQGRPPELIEKLMSEALADPAAPTPSAIDYDAIAEQWNPTVASYATEVQSRNNAIADATSLHGADSDEVSTLQESLKAFQEGEGLVKGGRGNSDIATTLGNNVNAAIMMMDASSTYNPAVAGTYTAPIQGASVDGVSPNTTMTFTDPNHPVNPFAVTQAQAGYTTVPSFAVPPSGASTVNQYLTEKAIQEFKNNQRNRYIGGGF